MILIRICLYSIVQYYVGAESEKERDFVLALWRHGKRSPMVFIEEFGDNLELWPDGK